MAIKVQGTTIIDDSRNIVNGIGASFTGIVTAATFSGSFSGDGSGITGVAGTGEFLQDADGNLFAGTGAGGSYDPVMFSLVMSQENIPPRDNIIFSLVNKQDFVILLQTIIFLLVVKQVSKTLLENVVLL
jgi:hypothetical protein